MSQRQYEILFIAEQNLGEPEVDTLTATVKGFIEKENGTVEKVEKWGKKRLAYHDRQEPRRQLRADDRECPRQLHQPKSSAACA